MEPSSAEDGSFPPKRARLTCAIHCTDVEPGSKLVSPQDLQSWKSLLRAAQIRNHEPILEIAKDVPEGEIPTVCYHRQCRIKFTMKKLLDSIITKKESHVETTNDNSMRLSRCSASSSRVYDKECIFCQKSSKYLKNQRTREPLIQCTDLRADAKIRNAAQGKLDDRILTIVSRELVAAEGHYHRSCYRIYTKEEPNNSYHAGTWEQVEDTEAQYDAAEKNSYSELFSYIRTKLFAKPEVLPMTDLMSKLISYMNSFGITEVKDSTKKHIRRRLEDEFAGTLHIFPDNKGKLLLYPDNLSMKELAKVTYSLKRELHSIKYASTSDIITKAALQMRDDIKKHSVSQVWPPDIENGENCIPTSITKFLHSMMTGEQDCINVSERVKRLTNSLGSDMVYVVSCGKSKPLKQILLPFAVKSLTGNVELIHTLNRLGHSVSYSQVEEIDTALCLRKLSMSGGNVAMPGNIHPHVFTTLAWDNIDRLEETVSGGGSSHRVNGIAVQAKVIGPQPFKAPCTVVKTKRRSITNVPLMMPTYNAGKRVGPPTTLSIDVDSAFLVKQVQTKNLVWLLARMSDPETQTISSWTGFNIQIRNDVTVVQDNVGYLPTINAPATQLSTVNEVLNQSLNIMHSLQLTKIVCVFDQALYAKAIEIIWKHDKFKDIIIRMGVFHTLCNLLSIIGKRFQDSGLRDLCVESGVIAEGSIGGVMEGRKYNRAIRLHKLVYEALMRLAWKGFLSWLEIKHSGDLVHLEETWTSIIKLCEGVCQASFEEVLGNASCTRIMDLFQNYLKYLRDENGNLSAFWMSYVNMVEIMLGLLRASREGNWILHQASIREMIPWCFAYDKLNYARFLSYYYAQMSQLPANHPEVHAHFIQGGFSVQLGSRNPFGRIPVDQTIEETVNKDTQTPGGTKGFSLNPAALTRYYLTSEYRSMYLRQLRDMIGRGESHLNHPDLQLPRIHKDEADVQSMVDLMECSWLNPLSSDTTEELVSLSTATVAPPEITNDLLNAQIIGEKAYQDFKISRLENNPPTAQFYDSMTKKNLKTFTHIRKKPNKNVSGKQVALKADRNLFGHMILIAQSRELNLSDVLAHPLGPLPWALANGDGSLRKTNKAALARELEKNVSPAEIISTPSATIIDGMSLIQKMKGNDKTFSQLAESAMVIILHEGAQSQRIDVVFDVYCETSIKNAERCNRGADGAIQFRSIAAGHNIQQWRKLLCSSSNKAQLIKFLVEEWKLPKYRQQLMDKLLIVTCEEVCYEINKDHWKVLADLESTQEEADTRMLLHALHAAKAGYKSVVIAAEDTDVLIICLGLHKDIPTSIYQKCGTKSRTRYIDIGKLAQSLGGSVCDALIGLHAFTGCDTVSAFAGRGKKIALKQMKSNTTYQEAFRQLGQSWDVSAEHFKKIQEITCHMYTASTNTSNVNELRYQIFCAKRGEAESSQLPPCQDCLFMHVLRANYQAAIWRHSLQNQPFVPIPQGCGWTTDDDGKLAIEWMQGSPAPDAVLQLLSCKCVRSCKMPDCTCLSNGLKCTNMCKLQTCINQPVEKDLTDPEDFDTDDEPDMDDDDDQ